MDRELRPVINGDGGPAQWGDLLPKAQEWLYASPRQRKTNRQPRKQLRKTLLTCFMILLCVYCCGL